MRTGIPNGQVKRFGCESSEYNYLSGSKLDFEDVCHVKTIQILTTDEKLSETVNTPKLSPIYLLILFRNASDADSENFVNPGVKSIRLDYEGDSNVIYQNGLKEPELYNEARRVFGKGELSTIIAKQISSKTSFVSAWTLEHTKTTKLWEAEKAILYDELKQDLQFIWS